MDQKLESVNLVQLRLAQDAGLAAFLFLVGGLRLDVAQHGGGVGQIGFVQPASDFGVSRGGVEDEFALAHENGQREVEFRFGVIHLFVPMLVILVVNPAMKGLKRRKWLK